MKKLLMLCGLLLTQLGVFAEGRETPQEKGEKYEWVGAMLDLSRHYFPVEHIHRQIDVLGRIGVNVLHLHLTDAAGWRMEIKKYPKFTEVAAFRTAESWKEWWNGDRGYSPDGMGGFYAQEDLREVVRHASECGITVVPEIEMPGHSEEVFAAYPELLCEGGLVSGPGVEHGKAQADFCAGSEKTFEYIFGILDEVMDVFPSEYIHIGGDEAGRQMWNTCGRCQGRMAELGLKTTAQMQAWFMRRVCDYLEAHGRRAVCWDEVLEGWDEMENYMAEHAAAKGETYSPGQKPIIMCWRGQAKGAEAVSKGFDVVMCPGEYCYFDNAQDAPSTQPEANGGYLPFDKVLSYNPMAGITQGKVLGLQGNLWAEYIPTPAHAEYMLYPRIVALAMVGNGTADNLEDARETGCALVKDLKAKGYNPFDLTKEVGQRPEMKETPDHLAKGCAVEYRHRYHKNYPASGDGALTDGVRGGWANNDGRWQGFIGADGMDVVIDLGAVKPIKTVMCDFQQICQPDIYLPETVIVSVSKDGKTYKEAARVSKEVLFSAIPSIERREMKMKAKARYVRVQALPRKEGGWVFCDEIVVK